MSKPPNWNRDELILALELYFKVNPIHTNEEHPAIVELSRILNQLPIHDGKKFGNQFRNPNGVYMKLCNFLRFDPNYHGVGLKRGSKLEETIWNEFSNDLDRLKLVTGAIIRGINEVKKTFNEIENDVDESEEFFEGRILTVIHKRRERNRAVVEKKKKSVLNLNGRLDCEICGFNFERTYGVLGRNFAECHHTKPLNKLTDSTSTRLSDLAIICANCHRMIHRTSPMQSIMEFKNKLSGC
jgi:5-methylcytosine-specific restriction protein A